MYDFYYSIVIIDFYNWWNIDFFMIVEKYLFVMV